MLFIYALQSILFLYKNEIIFSVKMKIRETNSNEFDLNECYSEYDLEQHLKDFSRQTPCVMLIPEVLNL